MKLERETFYGPGTRVYLIGKPISVTLTSSTGTIVGPDGDGDGYCIVHLDTPAIYHHYEGPDEPLPDIREAYDNLAASRIGRMLTCWWRTLITLPYRLQRSE